MLGEEQSKYIKVPESWNIVENRQREGKEH